MLRERRTAQPSCRQPARRCSPCWLASPRTGQRWEFYLLPKKIHKIQPRLFIQKCNDDGANIHQFPSITEITSIYQRIGNNNIIFLFVHKILDTISLIYLK